MKEMKPAAEPVNPLCVRQGELHKTPMVVTNPAEVPIKAKANELVVNAPLTNVDIMIKDALVADYHHMTVSQQEAKCVARLQSQYAGSHLSVERLLDRYREHGRSVRIDCLPLHWTDEMVLHWIIEMLVPHITTRELQQSLSIAESLENQHKSPLTSRLQVCMKRDADPPESLGYGYIVFHTEAVTNKALRYLNGLEVENATVSLILTKKPELLPSMLASFNMERSS